MRKYDQSKKIEMSLGDLNEGASVDQRRDLSSNGQSIKNGQFICPNCGAEIVSSFGNSKILGSLVIILVMSVLISGVYFSASWCGPCRQFSPLLVETYNKLKRQNKPFEIVLVSSDSDETAMENYMKEYNMAWPAVKYGSEEANFLKEHFQVSGIPYLVILNSSGDVISTNGRSEVANNKATVFDLWAE